MTILHNPTPPGLEPRDDLFAQAIRLAFTPARYLGNAMRVLNLIYWGTVLLVLGWIFFMAVDRAVPVETTKREVANPGRQVRPGEQLLVRSERKRLRSCELTRRWYVVDSTGRRFDYEPEYFDAFGPVTPEGAPPEPLTTGPVIPIDAAPGEAYWTSVLAWDCNPLQRALGWSIVAVLPRIKFEVLDRATPR